MEKKFSRFRLRIFPKNGLLHWTSTVKILKAKLISQVLLLYKHVV